MRQSFWQKLGGLDVPVDRGRLLPFAAAEKRKKA